MRIGPGAGPGETILTVGSRAGWMTIGAALLFGAALHAQEPNAPATPGAGGTAPSAPTPVPTPTSAPPRVQIVPSHPGEVPAPLPLDPNAIAPVPPKHSGEPKREDEKKERKTEFLAAPIPLSNP